MVAQKRKDRRRKKLEERKQKRKATTIETRKDTIVVGAIGNQNLGKSAMINGLALHKVVSVSRTPGHTKCFQTYNLAHDIILCDCPGMVFPALNRPKYMQVLCGLYPLANLREPFTPIGDVAEHIALEDLYGLRRFFVRDDEGSTTATAAATRSNSGIKEKEKEPVWSPMKIAEALANKRVDKTGRPDVHTAARNILFDVVDGVVTLCWAPPEPLELAQQLQQRDGTQPAGARARGGAAREGGAARPAAQRTASASAFDTDRLG